MGVIEAGEAGRPAVVFLHGLGTGAKAWQPQMEALADRYHVLALYQPGYGNTPGPFSLERAMAALDEVYGERGLATAHLCGLSMGTMVALAYALRTPERVSSLVLCGGFARLTDEMRSMALASVPIVRSMPDEEARANLSEPVPPAYREETLLDLAGVTSDDFATVMEQAGGFDVADCLGDLAIPTLVLCGELDEPNLPFAQEIAELIPGARLEIIPGAGHVANLDNPQAFTSILEQFFAGAQTISPAGPASAR